MIRPGLWRAVFHFLRLDSQLPYCEEGQATTRRKIKKLALETQPLSAVVPMPPASTKSHQLFESKAKVKPGGAALGGGHGLLALATQFGNNLCLGRRTWPGSFMGAEQGPDQWPRVSGQVGQLSLSVIS